MTLPTGTITLLFTDIEGSTHLWERFPEAMRLALARHDQLLRAAIERHNGAVFKTVGDAFCAAFPNATDALDAALEAQLALQREAWGETGPIRVRMGLHTGEAEERDNDYFGPVVNRVARLQAIGHGRQTLLSQAVHEGLQERLPPDATLIDRGLHRLKDLLAPEHVYEVHHPELPAEFPPLKSLDYLPTNLPQQLTSFIGREKERKEVKELLPRTRLLTLTGSGGTGKTRLSLQVAAEVMEDYADGVWCVELAALSDPARVVQAVATTLHLREQPGRPLTETLTNYLHDRSLLLVLDNCEHLLEACARLAESLLTRCAQIRIVATSREPLGISGEVTYRIPSLSFPAPKQSVSNLDLRRYEAVQLFLERAALQQPTFALTDRNASAVVSVCQRLDGIPLAIELATARMRAMPIEQIESRLDQRFRLLTGGSRTALPRQQTLRALMDWSYDLLNDQEKTLLHRLSVFAGGFTLDAAEQVCCSEEIETWEVPDLLLSLSDKSLVIYEESGGESRYRLLETVRQYAREKLETGAISDSVAARHRVYFLTLAEEGARHMHDADQGRWLAILETEHENLSAALEDCLQAEEGAEAGLRLGAALQRFWATRGYFREGREYLKALLARPEAQNRTVARAEALHGAGLLAFYQSDFPAAATLLEESLAIQRECGNRPGIAQALLNLGNIAYRRSDYATARSRYAQSFAIGKELGDGHSMAAALSNQGSLARAQGDLAGARSFLEQSLVIKREMEDDRGVAIALDNLGSLVAEQGDYARSYALHEQGLALQQQLGNREGIATALGNMGGVSYLRGDYDAARSLFEQSLEIRRELGDLGGMATSIGNLGNVASRQGDLPRALALHQESLNLERQLGLKTNAAVSLINLGELTLDQGALDASEAYLYEAIDLLHSLEERRLLAHTLKALALLRMAQRSPLQAAQLWGASAQLRSAQDAPVPPPQHTETDVRLEACRRTLGEATFTHAWQQGTSLPIEALLSEPRVNGL